MPFIHIVGHPLQHSYLLLSLKSAPLSCPTACFSPRLYRQAHGNSLSVVGAWQMSSPALMAWVMRTHDMRRIEHTRIEHTPHLINLRLALSSEYGWTMGAAGIWETGSTYDRFVLILVRSGLSRLLDSSSQIRSSLVRQGYRFDFFFLISHISCFFPLKFGYPVLLLLVAFFS